MKYPGLYLILLAWLFSSCHKERIETEKKYSGYFTFTYTKNHLDSTTQHVVTDTTIIYYGTITSYRPEDASKDQAYMIIKFRPQDEFKVMVSENGAFLHVNTGVNLAGGFSSENTMYYRWGDFSCLENIEGVRRY